MTKFNAAPHICKKPEIFPSFVPEQYTILLGTSNRLHQIGLVFTRTMPLKRRGRIEKQGIEFHQHQDSLARIRKLLISKGRQSRLSVGQQLVHERGMISDRPFVLWRLDLGDGHTRRAREDIQTDREGFLGIDRYMQTAHCLKQLICVYMYMYIIVCIYNIGVSITEEYLIADRYTAYYCISQQKLFISLELCALCVARQIA